MEWIKFVVFLGYLGFSSGTLSGPYLLWGHEKLRNMKYPALTEADEQSLSTLFTEAKAVVVFIRNSTNSRLDGENYPKFRKLVSENAWTYLPQHTLVVEPFNYNTNVEVINLVGPTSQQDTEITALFKDSVTIYGEGEVLGILAYREEEVHYMYKREANEEPPTTSITPTDEPTEANFIYNAPGNAILYTTTAPLLWLNDSVQLQSFALMEHDKEVTFDNRNDWSRLSIGFKVNNTRLRLRFNFTLSPFSYWSLKSVEVEYKEVRKTLPLVGEAPLAPKGFSYRCSSQSLIFRLGEDNLTLSDYQVQPWLKGATRFSDAYNCVGFTTVPIWSGLFVSALLIGLLFVGILALMDIKTPNKFESTRSKQLTFTVQE